MQAFKDSIENFAHYLFEENEETIVQGFNAMCGGNPNLSSQQTAELFNKVVENFNNISSIISSYSAALNIIGNNNNVLNTIQPKYLILKETRKFRRASDKKRT